MSAQHPLCGVVLVRALGPVAEVEEVDIVGDLELAGEQDELVTETYELPSLPLEPLCNRHEPDAA